MAAQKEAQAKRGIRHGDSTGRSLQGLGDGLYVT